MKKYSNHIVCIIFAITSFTGCKKKSNAPAMPDVSNFSATAESPYTVGNMGTVLVTSMSLAAGNYTVKYHYTADTSYLAGQSGLVMSNHTGSFQTPVLTSMDVTYVTIDSIINSIGNGVVLTTDSLVTFTDSTGLMIATIGSGSFRGLDIDAEISGNNLDMDGLYYFPGSANHQDLYVYISNYTGAGNYSFVNDFFGGGVGLFIYSFNGYVVDTGKYGTITVTATSPLLTGSFSATCTDSTKISGTFSCPAP